MTLFRLQENQICFSGQTLSTLIFASDKIRFVGHCIVVVDCCRIENDAKDIFEWCKRLQFEMTEHLDWDAYVQIWLGCVQNHLQMWLGLYLHKLHLMWFSALLTFWKKKKKRKKKGYILHRLGRQYEQSLCAACCLELWTYIKWSPKSAALLAFLELYSEFQLIV